MCGTVKVEGITFEPFVIRSKAEESECSHCGAPLYFGDRALLQEEAGRVYCGRSCAAYHKSDAEHASH